MCEGRKSHVHKIRTPYFFGGTDAVLHAQRHLALLVFVVADDKISDRARAGVRIDTMVAFPGAQTRVVFGHPHVPVQRALFLRGIVVHILAASKSSEKDTPEEIQASPLKDMKVGAL